MAKREPVAACATRVATVFLSPTVTRQINGGLCEQDLKLHLEHAGLAPQHALDFQLRVQPLQGGHPLRVCLKVPGLRTQMTTPLWNVQLLY